jgi:DNA-binding protein WhiA
MPDVVLTGLMRQELCRVRVIRPCCRKAEVSTALRLAAELAVAGGRVVVLEADLDTGEAAARIRREITAVFGHTPEATATPQPGQRGGRHVLRVVRDGDALARQAGLVDARGRPVRGLAPWLVAGPACDALAVWRGALLARGLLTGSGRGSLLEVPCPGPETALALAGAARRAGITARTSDRAGTDRVLIRDGDAITALLTRLGAASTVDAWREQLTRAQARTTQRKIGNFEEANAHRAQHAAEIASARVEHALRTLGDTTPAHLHAAGLLRLAHPHASLEELGRLADPPMTKDAIAGRIRRLIAIAARHTPARTPDPMSLH